MALVLTTAPTVEPVSLADAKLHLRIDGTAEDALINSLILTSRLHIETALGLALIAQNWSYFIDRWPSGRVLELPLRPVSAISAIRVYASDGSFETVAPSSYVTDVNATAPRVVLQTSAARPAPGRPANGIEIAMTAGYGTAAADVPQPIRQALLILAAHWYEHREVVELDGTATRVPDSASALLASYRPVRL